MKTAHIFIVVLMFPVVLMLAAGASAATVKTIHKIKLGASLISVNVYENPGAQIIFFALHYDEQMGAALA